MDDKVKEKLLRLDEALKRLEEMAVEPVGQNRAEIDSTIQRFEFCFEKFWKTLKTVNESLGFVTPSPRQAIEKAFQSNIIDNEDLWLQMMKDRNETSHVYDQKIADQIYKRITESYAIELRKCYNKLVLQKI